MHRLWWVPLACLALNSCVLPRVNTFRSNADYYPQTPGLAQQCWEEWNRTDAAGKIPFECLRDYEVPSKWYRGGIPDVLVKY